MDPEEKKRRCRERSRLAYWKQFEGKTPEEIEVLRKKIRARGAASYYRCRVLKVKRTPEERRARRRAQGMKRYYASHDVLKAKQRNENLTPEQIDRKRRTARAWRAKNRDRINAEARERNRRKRVIDREKLNKASAAYLRKRRKTDPEFRLLCTLRARTKALLRRGVEKLRKAGRTKDLCGEGFFEHVQRELKPGMDLVGPRTREWHLDHVIPCSWFDLTRADHQFACFHWSNIQPEFAFYNLSKADTCACADVDRVLARCPEEFRAVFLEMRLRAEREEQVRKLSNNTP